MLYTQAESLLSIPGLGCEAHAQDHACLPAIPPLPESIYVNEADLIIQSSDFVEFRIHKSMLAFSSQVFRDMFSLPQPSNEIVDGLPVLRLSEDAELVRALITVLYLLLMTEFCLSSLQRRSMICLLPSPPSVLRSVIEC
jgi:hypothetical protein